MKNTKDFIWSITFDDNIVTFTEEKELLLYISGSFNENSSFADEISEIARIELDEFNNEVSETLFGIEWIPNLKEI